MKSRDNLKGAGVFVWRILHTVVFWSLIYCGGTEYMMDAWLLLDVLACVCFHFHFGGLVFFGCSI